MFGKRVRSKSNLDLNKESLDASMESLTNGSFQGGQEFSFHPSISNRALGFPASYLGAVSMFMMPPNSRKSIESQLISKIEEEQLDGKLKLKPSAKDAVWIRLDRHGFQIAREDGDDIILRVPLHTLAQLLLYEDGYARYNLAVKVIVGKDLFSCHVFQCLSEDIALSICETLQRVFRTIMAESDASI